MTVGAVVIATEVALCIASCILMAIFPKESWLVIPFIGSLVSIPITCYGVDRAREQRYIYKRNKQWLKTHEIKGLHRQTCLLCKYCVVKTYYSHPWWIPYPHYCKKLKKEPNPSLTTICCADLYEKVEWVSSEEDIAE